MQFELDGHAVFAGNGHQASDPQQRTLVFIHGAGMDHTVWLMYERYFARCGFNVLAIDLPGHGRSGGDALKSINEMASWIDRVLDTLDVQTATLVGHSMGSLVAYECAAEFSERVEKAILLGFAFPMAVGPPLLEAARANDSAAVDMMVIFGHDFRSQLGGNRVAGVHVTNSAKRLLEKNRPGVLFADLNACNEYANEAAAAKISCPLIFLSGERDKMTSPRAAAAMADQVSNGRMVQIADSGHGVMAEQPELTHRELAIAIAD